MDYRDQKRMYYLKTATWGHERWTAEEERLLFRCDITDHEISRQTGRSVGGIQLRRWKLKKGLIEPLDPAITADIRAYVPKVRRPDRASAVRS